MGWTIFCFIYAFVKLSILALFLRVVGTTHKKFRFAVYIMMVLIVAMTLGIIIDFLTYCDNVAKVYHIELPGTCQFSPRLPDLFFAQAVLAVTTDFMILIPPIPFIWRMSWDLSRKIGFLGLIVFALWYVPWRLYEPVLTENSATAVALFRTVVYSPGGWRYEYEMYDQYWQTFLYMLEINGALSAICLPVLGQLFRRVRTDKNSGPRQGAHANEHGDPSDPSSEGSGQKHSGGKKKRGPISQMIYGLSSRFDRSQAQTEFRGDAEKAIPEADSTSNRSDAHIAEGETIVWQGDSDHKGIHTVRGQRYEC